jgi:DNA invertase Pin-like site-specific DNA recombinase
VTLPVVNIARINQHRQSVRHVKGAYMRPPHESCFRVLELALPHPRVMLSLERQGEHDMSKHHAIYMRVSTKRQDTASQEPELKRWAQLHEGDSCWYQDSYTGTSMDRPGFRKLVKDMETGQVDTLVVWRLDRLGRTAKGSTGLFEDLIRWKVNLISLKDGLDLVTPAGRLMANILAGVAAYETEVRAERILAGQAAARKRGIRWGGSIRGRRIRATAEQIAVVRRLW